jgi:RNA polymerase sigma factor (sigma-70 family)
VPPRETSDPGDDEALTAAFAAGADGAMRRVWDRYGTLVHTFCVRSLSDRDAAADCTQETFISAWRSRDRFDATRGSLPGWLLGIARHRVHDAYRARARTPLPDAADDRPVVADGGAERESEELVERLLVADALATLPERPRRVLELAFYSGLSQREIAERTDQPLGTVKSDMRRALLRLRTVLEGGDVDG